jgi:hypothetical protein
VGGNFAGAAKFSFRQTDDPRYTDRRMQNLIRKIDESFQKYGPTQVADICKLASVLSCSVFYCEVEVPC